MTLALEADPKTTFSKEEWIFALVGWVLENHLTNADRPIPEMVNNINRALDNSTIQELENLIASFPKEGMESAVGRFLASKIW